MYFCWWQYLIHTYLYSVQCCKKETNVHNVNIEKALYRKKVKLLIIEIKKSNKPIFIKHHTKIFSRASEYKQEPTRPKEKFKEEEYTSGLFIRSSRDIDYLKGQELYEHFEINFRNTEIDEY